MLNTVTVSQVGEALEALTGLADVDAFSEVHLAHGRITIVLAPHPVTLDRPTVEYHIVADPEPLAEEAAPQEVPEHLGDPDEAER